MSARHALLFENKGPGRLARPPRPPPEGELAMYRRGDETVLEALCARAPRAGASISEVLFRRGLNPFGPARALPPRALAGLYDALAGPPGAAGPGVYGRAGEPCPRCGGPVGRLRLGPPGGLFFCAPCQRASPPGPGRLAKTAGARRRSRRGVPGPRPLGPLNTRARQAAGAPFEQGGGRGPRRARR